MKSALHYHHPLLLPLPFPVSYSGRSALLLILLLFFYWLSSTGSFRLVGSGFLLSFVARSSFFMRLELAMLLVFLLVVGHSVYSNSSRIRVS